MTGPLSWLGRGWAENPHGYNAGASLHAATIGGAAVGRMTAHLRGEGKKGDRRKRTKGAGAESSGPSPVFISENNGSSSVPAVSPFDVFCPTRSPCFAARREPVFPRHVRNRVEVLVRTDQRELHLPHQRRQHDVHLRQHAAALLEIVVYGAIYSSR